MLNTQFALYLQSMAQDQEGQVVRLQRNYLLAFLMDLRHEEIDSDVRDRINEVLKSIPNLVHKEVSQLFFSDEDKEEPPYMGMYFPSVK